MIEAVKLFATTEGILLDPVYTGKIAAGMIGMIREKRFKPSDNILFIHTGGATALHAYEAVLS
jgi:D-cysteine desulfhydrase